MVTETNNDADLLAAEEMSLAEQAAIEEQINSKRTVIKKGKRKKMAELERSRDAKLKKLERLQNEQQRVRAILKRGYFLKLIKVPGEAGTKSYQKKLDSADRAKLRERISSCANEIMDLKDEIKILRDHLKKLALRIHQYNKEQKQLRIERRAKKLMASATMDDDLNWQDTSDVLSTSEISLNSPELENVQKDNSIIGSIDQAEAALGTKERRRKKAA